MPYTNNNVMSQIAKAMKKMKVDTEGSIDSKKLAYDAQSDTFEAARAAAQLAFDTAYAAKETAKASSEAASLSASLAAVQAASDAIVNDDADASVVDTLAEMEAQINADLAAYTAQQTAYEGQLDASRLAITNAWGVMGDYSNDDDSSYSDVSIVA
jgi:hypothetical protein